MEDIFIPILAIAGFFSSIIIWTYMYFSSRHRERMALIESGADATIFKQDRDNSHALKYGIVAVMCGVGVLFGNILDNAGLQSFVAYFSMILIFGGLGLVGFYFYIAKREGLQVVS